MKFKVLLFKDEDGYMVASCPTLPGCASQGRNRDEALRNIQDAISGCLQVRKEMGYPLTNDDPSEIVEVEVAV